MNEEEIRALTTDQLITLKAKLNIEELNMTDKDRIVKLEAAVSTLIARFKAAEEEKEEEKEEKKETMKAEEEMKAEEALKVKAEEEKCAEEEVPTTNVQAEEGGELAGIEAKLAELMKMIEGSKFKANDGAVTPETPEDEPAMTKIKPPKIVGHPNSPAKWGDTKIYQTPAHKPGPMKAGKEFGKSQSSNGAANKQKAPAELTALNEIFTFGAKRGMVPMAIQTDISQMMQ